MSNKFKYNIMITGLYFSGSSAVTDLLQEYEGIGIVPGEFDDFRRVGMVGDHLQGKIADDYRCNIRNFKYNLGGWIPRYCSGRANIRNLIKRVLLALPIKKSLQNSNLISRLKLLDKLESELNNSDNKQDRINIVRSWLQEVRNIYLTNEPYAVFDQPIFSSTHQDVWPKVFDPYKLIVVYRDPRDQIAQLIKQKLIYFDIETPTRGLLEIYGDDRLGAIRYELDALKARFKNAKKLQEKLGEDKVKIIAFEDLVNNYEETKNEIEKFIGIEPKSHINKKSIFDPSISVKNIGLYTEYLTKEELELFNGLEFP